MTRTKRIALLAVLASWAIPVPQGRAVDLSELGPMDLQEGPGAFEVRLIGGLSFYDYSLGGSGFQLSAPMKRGYVLGAELRYTFSEAGIIAKARHKRGSQRLDGLQGLSPEVAAVRSSETRVLAGPVGAASAAKVCYAAWTKG